MDREIAWGLVRVFIVLAILTPILVYVTRWYGKRQRLGSSIVVKETVPLGTNRALCVVEWENNRFLLGVTNQNITILEQHTISDEEEHSGEETT
ncbi:MAG: flagellar biosynthetic protein FliO [Firmicutes bacterium]|jgi:flagellar biogenesis protein FliO|nr:flagellar biosynthetic protein FliO [Bacillota bacterium]